MSAEDAQTANNMVEVDPGRVADIYREKYQAADNQAVLLQAALGQSQAQVAELARQVEALQKQVEALTPKDKAEAPTES